MRKYITLVWFASGATSAACAFLFGIGPALVGLAASTAWMYWATQRD